VEVLFLLDHVEWVVFVFVFAVVVVFFFFFFFKKTQRYVQICFE
jgi:hypothetical protein